MPGGVATGIPTLVMVFVLGLAAGAESQQAPAPAPAAGGCTALLAQVADCLQYVTPGSPLIRPPEKCCAEVNAGLKDAAAVACVCGLLGGRNFNLPLNLTRTAGLPVACGAPATSLSQCNGCNVPAPGSTIRWRHRRFLDEVGGDPISDHGRPPHS
ncbi:hypothetical protein ACP4OV_022438 [Aristida adscensionis]